MIKVTNYGTLRNPADGMWAYFYILQNQEGYEYWVNDLPFTTDKQQIQTELEQRETELWQDAQVNGVPLSDDTITSLAARRNLRDQYNTHVNTLQSIIDAESLTNAQAITAIQTLARGQKFLINYIKEEL